MARAVPAMRHNDPGDEVQRSLEVLDRVLSEYEEPQTRPTTEQVLAQEGGQPRSPSQHSEDDGYMSMNGTSHRTKFCPNFRTTLELTATEASASPTDPDLVTTEPDPSPEEIPEKDSPPTPQEAERIIATLLPWSPNYPDSLTSISSTQNAAPAQQATLPKGRCSEPAPVHPYNSLPAARAPPPALGVCIAAVHAAVLSERLRPSDAPPAVPRGPPTPVLGAFNEHPVTIYPGPREGRVPPKTLAGSCERHREVRRAINQHSPASPRADGRPPPMPATRDFSNRVNTRAPATDSDGDFSDDSLEGSDSLPPPPPLEMTTPPPLETTPSTTPSSSPTPYRHQPQSRSKTFADFSALCSSTPKESPMKESPPPPPSPLNRIFSPQIASPKCEKPIINQNDRYNREIVRNGIKKTTSLEKENNPRNKYRAPQPPVSKTFSDFTEGIEKLEHATGNVKRNSIAWEVPLDDTPSNVSRSRRSIATTITTAPSQTSPAEVWPAPPDSPGLPPDSPQADIDSTGDSSDAAPWSGRGTYVIRRRKARPPVAFERDEDTPSPVPANPPLREIESNISALLRGEQLPRGGTRGPRRCESAKELLLQNLPPLPPTPIGSPDAFPPLPPSPVQEEEESPSLTSITEQRSSKTQVSTLPVPDRPPMVPPHRTSPSMHALKTRSMDAGFSRSQTRTGSISSETAPQQAYSSGYTGRRRGVGQRRAPSSHQSPTATSSLPDTPTYVRTGTGSLIAPSNRKEEPTPPPSVGSRTQPRISGQTGSYSHSLTVGHNVPGLSGLGGLAGLGPPGAALSGGPARGWYPQRSKPRPLSSEHLDRLQQVGGTHIRGVGPLAWGTDTQRKPQTLPPNLSPKFFHRSPREALRRVTSLLIRKGANGAGATRESRKEREGSVFPMPLGQTVHRETIEETMPKQRRGFLKNFFKKSKHYSLDQ